MISVACACFFGCFLTILTSFVGNLSSFIDRQMASSVIFKRIVCMDENIIDKKVLPLAKTQEKLSTYYIMTLLRFIDVVAITSS